MHENQHGFNWISLIPGLEHAPNHVVMAILVAVMLSALGFVATLRLRSAKNPIIPEERMTYRNFFDLVAESIYKFCEGIMGAEAAERYFPLVGTLFLFIFTSNLFGLIPGFLPPTDNINTTMAAGLFVFFFYNVQGFRAHGLGYLKHFMGPVIFLAPLMIIIELVSHLARPLSLALRLRGNMMGDHAVLSVFLGLTPYVLPVIFYFLGMFVAFVQAYVFCLLSMIYISLSIAHDH